MSADGFEDILRAARGRPLYEPDPGDAVALGRGDIERLLPHRDPFLFVDRVTAVDLGGLSIAGCRRIDPSDPVFVGHFPDEPIYPGVLQLETMGQLGLCLFGLLKNGRTNVVPEDCPRPARALRVHHAAFQAPIGPGDELTILAKAIDAGAYTGICAGQLLKRETVCALAIMEVYFVEE